MSFEQEFPRAKKTLAPGWLMGAAGHTGCWALGVFEGFGTGSANTSGTVGGTHYSAADELRRARCKTTCARDASAALAKRSSLEARRACSAADAAVALATV